MQNPCLFPNHVHIATSVIYLSFAWVLPLWLLCDTNPDNAPSQKIGRQVIGLLEQVVKCFTTDMVYMYYI